ncbi:PAS domain S-box protein [Halomicroarcula sp. GCM10025817]|uniref:sensor histidine kinase n=1 Tax=Haloarcula TaxID=2237 RepID=UPI0023E79384|nr:PAS domain S-box protein [Halomicroarcula sp. SYNS111]
MSTDTDRAPYRDIFELSPTAVMVHDPSTGAIRAANQAACELVGLDYETLLETPVGAFSPPGFTTADAASVVEEAMENGSAQTEWVVQTPAGDRRWVDVTLKRSTEGDDDAVLAFAEDVSENKQLEREQTEQTEQLRTLVQNLPVVMFTLDPDGTFASSAGKGLDALGISPGEFVGESIFDVYAESPDIVSAAKRALAGEEVRSTQAVDGMVFETWYRPIFDDGDLTAVVGVARDITELKRHETHVESLSEATKQLLYTHTESAVAETVTELARDIVDRPFAVMWTDDGTDDTLHPVGGTVDAVELAGVDSVRDLPAIGPGCDEQAIFDSGEPTVVDDYRELDTPWASDVPLGTVLYLPLDEFGLLCVGSTSVEPFSDNERVLLEILARTATAALERVAREQRIEAKNDELERANEALRRQQEQMDFFNSILRHDMLNGMHVIRARGEFLASALDGQQREFAETIVDWSDDIIDLTQKVRAVLETLADPGLSNSKPVALTPVVESAAQRARSMDSSATVNVSLPGDYDVLADELLSDVFGNIFTNAIEHAEVDGGVTIDVTATATAEAVTVRIADDGGGIRPSVRRRVFERGAKGVESAGTGFGLYFVDAMIESYGGTIWVEESHSGGAAFVVELVRD